MKHWALCIFLLLSTSFAHAERKALLIGNASYNDRPLRNPPNDVKGMKQVLTGLGFKVVDKTNLSKKAMKRAIREFSDGLAHDDEALFYFSGHGASVAGHNYLIPLKHDIQHEDEVGDEAVPLNFVLNKLTKSPSRLNIVILDACRDNPFQSRFKSSSKGLSRLKTGIKGTIVAFAASEGGVSEDGHKNYGTYTEYLIKHLPTPNITINQMFNRVRADVNEITHGEQFPIEENGLLGDVVLAQMLEQENKQEPETPSSKVQRPPVTSNEPARVAFEPAMIFIKGNTQINDFWIGQYEVTFDDWQACANDGGCQSNPKPDDQGWGRGKRPVINVSWHDANEYTDWLSRKTGHSYRLPTSAEWEYMARAGSTTDYHFGNNEADLCRYANHADRRVSYSWRNTACDDGVGEQTALVGQYQPNQWGIYDVHGNVREWTCSPYAAGYDGFELKCANTNDSRSRVLRGGSWSSEPGYLRSAYRYWSTATYRNGSVGFRLARTR